MFFIGVLSQMYQLFRNIVSIGGNYLSKVLDFFLSGDAHKTLCVIVADACALGITTISLRQTWSGRLTA